MRASAWDPKQYDRYAAEREQPFWDLVSLLEPSPSPRVVDLGCGDGRLTAALHQRLSARATTGIDSSPEMLAAARSQAAGTLRFVPGDMATWSGARHDLVVSNAALQWVADHARILGRWRRALAAGGQLAVQVPANADHPTHRLAREVGSDWLGADAPPDPVVANVLLPEEYAQLLELFGFVRQHVRLQVYGYRLPSTADVVEWMRGTSLTRFRAVLAPDEFERFVSEYRRRLIAELGDHQPYFYPFKRILLWGRLPE